MKKIILITAILTYSIINFSQNVYFTRTATIDFFSSTPVEDIKAKNKHVISILKAESMDINFGLMIKLFTFENSLMQEHFNENYMESEKFPKAIFKGKLTDKNNVDFNKDGVYTTNIKGTMTIHGVSKKINAKAIFTIKDGKISAKSTLKIKPDDYGIEIPTIVTSKIAEELLVSIFADYELYKK